MQPRRIARELALLSSGQLTQTVKQLSNQDLQAAVVAAVRTLASEVHDALETAATELKRGNEKLLTSETRAADVQSARAMVQESIGLTESAMNRLGQALELPEFIQLSNQQEVRDYAYDLLRQLQIHRVEIDQLLESALVEWQLHRLAQLDKQILRLAVVEMRFLEVPNQVAVNEAVELAKRYSGEDGHRFINGVLRRVIDHKTGQDDVSTLSPEESDPLPPTPSAN
jgi:N utilization substance protein B